MEPRADRGTHHPRFNFNLCAGVLDYDKLLVTYRQPKRYSLVITVAIAWPPEGFTATPEFTAP
jgi:hypothetical protein